MILAAAPHGLAAVGPDGGSAELLAWAQGPVRWFLLPSDWREIKRIDDPAEALNFVDRFWRLRDPDPSTEENELHAIFAQRVEAADLLYPEGDVRGSLTARGRALILLGPPPRMQITTEDALTWEPRRKSRSRSSRRDVRIEIWSYTEADLPEKLVRVLRAADLDTTVDLKFRLGRRGAQLAGGENALITAARLTLVQD